MRGGKIYFMWMVLMLCSVCGMAEEKVSREAVEWCDIWITSAHLNNKPRVLLVGDSITRGYFKAVENRIGEAAHCAQLATSACIADPAFLQQLELVLSQYNCDVIHFNNGIHGVSCSDSSYEAGYRKALQTIKRMAPSARVVLALTTPLKDGSDRAYLNGMVDRRNQVVQKLAEEYNMETDDLYSISKGHPEYYVDHAHYNPAAVELQGEQVASMVRRYLAE